MADTKQVHTDKSMSVAARLAALPNRLRNADEVDKAASIVRDGTESPEMRAAVLGRLGGEMQENQDHVDLAIGLVKNTAEPSSLRVAALKALQGASFHSPRLQASLPEFMAALRESARDEDPDIRQRVLGALAQHKDEFAQRLLIEGLQNPASALIEPEKAVELLAYDIHAEHYPLLRELVSRPPNEATRIQAIRSLAADPGAAPLLRAILRNPADSLEARTRAAHTLRALDAPAFEVEAKQIIPNDAEPDDLRITCLMALTVFGDRANLRKDGALNATADRLRIEFAETPLGAAARKFSDEMRKP
jgi:hypothetical protein